MLDGYAQVYHALRQVMSPAEADRCEIWQLGAVLGLHIDKVDEPVAATGTDNVRPLRPRAGATPPNVDPTFMARRDAWLAGKGDPAVMDMSDLVSFGPPLRGGD